MEMNGNAGKSADRSPQKVPEFANCIGRYKSIEVSPELAGPSSVIMGGCSTLPNSHMPTPQCSDPQWTPKGSLSSNLHEASRRRQGNGRGGHATRADESSRIEGIE